jgi:hypothetical protein
VSEGCGGRAHTVPQNHHNVRLAAVRRGGPRVRQALRCASVVTLGQTRPERGVSDPAASVPGGGRCSRAPSGGEGRHKQPRHAAAGHRRLRARLRRRGRPSDGMTGSLESPSLARSRQRRRFCNGSLASPNKKHMSSNRRLLLCCNALHFKHCGVIYRLEQMPKYRHTTRLVVNVAFTPRR